MKGLIYEIPEKDTERLAELYTKMDEALQSAITGKNAKSINEVTKYQDQIKKYLSDKKIIGKVDNSKEAINALSLKFGMVIAKAQIDEAIIIADEELKKVLMEAQVRGCSVALETC